MTLLEMMPYGTMCRTAHQKVPFHVNTTLKTILQDDWILDLCCKKREIGLAAIKTGRSCLVMSLLDSGLPDFSPVSGGYVVRGHQVSKTA
jgi:hypothetical protein